ncbi:MAG: response regulator transcription factor [Parcubacteria group bacterium]|nr:response regulator transcription factor [Parcubacteria group bacterium]
MRILIIEDNDKLARSLKKGLEQEGFTADFLTEGDAGYRRIEASHATYDAVILDRMLPKMDGLEICREARKKGIAIPILMLTAKDTIRDKIEGLHTGADDYLVKPFAFMELVARLHALLRRPQGTYAEEVEGGRIILNPSAHRVMKNGKEIKLTQREFAILHYMMKHPERVLSRQEILDHAWDYDFNPFSNIVDVKIKNLRKKIKDTDGTMIETVRGVGYRFNPN